MKLRLKAPGTKRLRLKCDLLPSTSAFKFNLGPYTAEAAAAQAYENYIKEGVVPARNRERTSHFMGVCWYKRQKKWMAKCKGKYLGNHATEQAAALAYNVEAERLGMMVQVDSIKFRVESAYDSSA
jgi:hypothetical protein